MAFVQLGRADMSQRLAEAASSLLERRTSRRSVLSRAALTGSAFVVAPLRYLLRPVSAWAVVAPGNCGGGLCDDGYTAFCCEINHGKNVCPPHTYVGGWWMCTAYQGRGLCAPQGVRYYVDCNQTPGQGFPGGCRCANDNCSERRVDCNVFRYGQCNTQVGGTTAVGCRVVVCQNPASIDGFNCNGSVAVDDNTCTHEWNCLTPLVQQLPGDGGA
ncbi:MAG: hypothetical protein ACR2HD_11105 [Solirubrobacteraceae bacterium]|nr:MAG: hypothetical protein DLM63_13070 [Solirubrobacterales bacterium]